MEEQPHSSDIAIICALYEEAGAVLDEFSSRCGVTFTTAFRALNHLEYRYATIQNRRGEPLTIFVTWLSRTGPIRTALDLVPLLHEIHPRFVAMTGMCAGDRNQVKLGDLIIATEAYHPEEGKTMTGTGEQPAHWPETRIAGATTQVLQYAQSFDQWRNPVHDLKRQLLIGMGEVLDEPERHIGVIASSMAVRADHPFPTWTTQYHRKTIGVDMEAAAFYLALRDFPLLHGLVVKGVSDYGDSSKNDAYHDYAARASAVYLLYFIREYVTQETMPRREAPLPIGIWNVPYLRNPHFTGRDELLDRLDQQLSSMGPDASTTTRRAALTQPQAIKGLGGIGKTQIAVEYAYRCREQGHYTHTLWVNAASEEALLTSFVALAELLPSFSARDEKDQGKLVGAIKRWLEQCQERWLLIFDNADDLTGVQEYFPKFGNGSILLTTRAHAVASIGASLEVETMSFVEGTHLLLRRAERFEQVSDEEFNEAGNIVVALDHFPLALDQAGAYIDETNCRFDDYLSMYQDHRSVLLARRGAQAINYPDSVATTWSLSFQRVEQTNPAAAELLRLCAYLSPDRIPEELIKDGAAHWTPLLQQAATDQFRFNQMIEELLKFSLVKRLVEEQMLSIHRLVQAVQIEKMELEVQNQWAERVVLAINEVFPRAAREVATWPQCLRYLEQAQACDLLIRRYMLVRTEAADLLHRTGDYLREHASYTLAETLYQRALDIREQHLTSSLNGLADLYREQGKYAEAEPLFQRALHILERQVGVEHSLVAYPLHGLAGLYLVQGKYAEAEPLFQRTLRIREQQLGETHPDVAYPLNGLANLYLEQGKYAEAELLFQRALRIWEQHFGETHPDVAMALINLANLYREQGKHAEAELLCERALRIGEQQLGMEHPLVATAIHNLAEMYREQGKYAEAEPLFERALRIREKQLGAEHSLVAQTLNNWANLYQEQGKSIQAEPLFQRALHISEQQLGETHPDVAYPLNGLAELYREQGKYAEAEPLFQRALRIWEQHFGETHSLVAYPLNNLAELYQALGKYAEAEPLFERALHIFEQTRGPQHLLVAHPLAGLAELYQVRGNYTQAELYFERILSIRESALEPHHPDIAETLHHFATLRTLQSSQKEAASLYQRALAIREQVFGHSHAKTTETRDRLRAVLTTLGRMEEAARLDEAQPESVQMKGEYEAPQRE